MIELYTAGTPNGRKISIMLEELALSYNVHPLNLGKNEQKAAEYLAINPNGRIPAIVDSEGPGGKPINIFESGAILIYLAEKTGQLIPRDAVQRLEAIEWLMFQMAGTGPMFGQLGWFMRNGADNEQALRRYTDESVRLAGVLDHRLGQAEYLAGEYSIADIANYTWAAVLPFFKIGLDTAPHLKRWLEAVGARPAVQRGLKVPA
ncbi:MAG: glutathione S-transferase N-terminal domain-containing protein [Candidatus Binataceae bacterium]|jgi:GST-like protein